MKSLDFEGPNDDYRGANDGRNDKQTETRPDKSEIYICTFHVLPRFLLPAPRACFKNMLSHMVSF